MSLNLLTVCERLGCAPDEFETRRNGSLTFSAWSIAQSRSPGARYSTAGAGVGSRGVVKWRQPAEATAALTQQERGAGTFARLREMRQGRMPLNPAAALDAPRTGVPLETSSRAGFHAFKGRPEAREKGFWGLFLL